MMEQQYDPWHNSDQQRNKSWDNVKEGLKAIAAASALAEANSRTARICRARAWLEEALSAPWTPSHSAQIVLASLRLADVMVNTSTMMLAPPLSLSS